MAKKRKLVPKSTTTTASTSTSTQHKKLQKKQQEEQQPPPQPPPEELKPVEEEEEEMEEVEEEEYEEVEVEDDEEEEEEDDGNNDEEDEPIANLLEPFTKEQLFMICREAAENHADVAARVRKVADEDTVHRKIFVHGLGWDTTADTLRTAFFQYGDIEDCKAVTDKISGKSKGYGFILFKTRTGARNALKEPQKKIGSRMTACQLAAVGPVMNTGSGAVQQAAVQPQSEYTQRKIYVSNVSADIDPGKLTAYFSKFGEIEEGPLGIDKSSGKFKGFCLFVYKSVESARKALEEPHKQYEGHTLHCQKAIDGPKPGKQGGGMQGRGGKLYGRNDNPNLVGAIGGTPATAAGLMGQSVGGVPFNQGSGAGPGLNPAFGQALTALLASQGAGIGLNNFLGSLGGGIGAPGVAHLGQGGYGAQGIGPGVLSGYGGQAGLQSAYPNQQTGQGGGPRGSQHGHMGGVAPYSGH